jgi:hypothetical protein
MTKNSRKLVLRVGSETTHAHGQVTCFSQALDNSQTPGGRANSPRYGHLKFPHLTTVD